MDICNCMFGMDRGNPMLRYALDAALKSCPAEGPPCTGGTGPGFWMDTFSSYQPTDVLLFSWANLLFPTETAVTYHTWEGSWNGGHVVFKQFCEAVGLQHEAPKTPFAHNGAGHDQCRRLELWLRRWYQWVPFLALLLIVGALLRYGRARNKAFFGGTFYEEYQRMPAFFNAEC